MAVIPHFRLSKSAVRALVFIESGVKQGLSSRQISATLRGTEFAVRRAELLEAIRYIRGVERTGPQLRSIRKDLRPDPASFPRAQTKIRREFSIRATVTGVHSQTGISATRNITLSLDRLLPIGEMENLARDMVADQFETSDLIELSSVLGDGVKAGKLGTF